MQIEDFNESLEMLHKEIADLLNDFRHVSNPREVTGYYIYKDWENKLPLKKTGLIARLNENEKIELIATLSGGVFNQIEISSPSGSIISNVVPHDQAFNYRTGSYNTVCFSGETADSIAGYIYTHKNDNLKLIFLNGKKTGELNLPEDEKVMVGQTWKLFDSQYEVKILQRKLNIYSNAVNACRRLLDENEKME